MSERMIERTVRHTDKHTVNSLWSYVMTDADARAEDLCPLTLS